MTSDEFKTYRQRIVEYLMILSSAEEQREYQRSVPYVNVPDELICMWFDDLAMPESLKYSSSVLTKNEVELVRKFSESLDNASSLIRKPNQVTIEELLNNEQWNNIIADALRLLNGLNRKS